MNTPPTLGYKSPFARAKANACPPAGTEVIPARAFSPEWDGKPDDEVCFGIRPLSNTDIDFVRGEAFKRMQAAFPGIDVSRDEVTTELATQAYNDGLMRLAVARGTCDPNDARRPHPVWQGMADDIVHDALTVEGTKAIYDALERTTIAASPVRREIKDDELEELITKAPKALAAMPDWQARRVRRLLAWALDAMRESLAEPERVLPDLDAVTTETE